MYYGLLLTHSYLRWIILVMLIIVILMSLSGMVGNKRYTDRDNKTGLFLFICTHIQLLIGIILFFVSPAVRFSAESMKDSESRYWLVEHNTAMIIAIVFITLARTTSKRMAVDRDKHRRMFIFNLIALVIIITTIALSTRDFFLFR